MVTTQITDSSVDIRRILFINQLIWLSRKQERPARLGSHTAPAKFFE